MELIKTMLENADLLYKIAYSKTDDSHEAEDLVQETYLSVLKALNKGTKIDNMRAYLLKTLKNKYYDSLKMQHNRYQIYLSEIHKEPSDQENETNISDTDEATIVRRELAFLAKKYRDILIQYYIEGKKVEEIALALSIPIGTVKSRLDSAREKIKKGIESMNSFTENSFRPDLLTITVGGFTGMHNEPLSVISSTIEQNLLILAYDKPVSIEELSKSIGIPMAFIEESVEKLVNHELMKKDRRMVWTNFPIIGEDMIKETKEIQKKFVDSHFNEAKAVYSDLINEYKDSGILNIYNETQLYLFGLFSMHHQIREWIVDEYKLLKWDDYPDRPYGGKWIVLFGQKYSKSNTDNFLSSYTIGGDYVSINSEKLSIELKDNPVGVSPWRENKNLNTTNLIQLMYSIHQDQDIEERQMHLIPELLKMGFLKQDENNKIKLNIPLISDNEYSKLQSITRKYTEKYIELLGKKLRKYINTNIIKYPKLIKPVSPYVYLLCVADIPLTYFYTAAENGVIEYDKTKNYPLCMIIKR